MAKRTRTGRGVAGRGRRYELTDERGSASTRIFRDKDLADGETGYRIVGRKEALDAKPGGGLGSWRVGHNEHPGPAGMMLDIFRRGVSTGLPKHGLAVRAETRLTYISPKASSRV